MEIEPPLRVFRVTVRGRFADLIPEARRHLVDAQADHDILRSGFTAEGTLTYDARIDFFNVRYEIRARGADAESVAVAQATETTELFFRTLRIGFRDLRAQVMDMSAMTERRSRRS